MASKTNKILTAAVVRVLRPLVRVLIRHEMSHAEFSELARHAYVKEAYQHFGIKGRKMTYSRVAVLTGLTRKEVVRQVNLDDSELSEPSSPTRAVRVIDGWLHDQEFQTNDGLPAQLSLHGDVGSFTALVARYSGDISQGAVADELERVGVVVRPSKGTIKLIEAGYIPQGDELEKVHILSVCTADLLATAAHNVSAEQEDRRFQRQLSYADVPESVAEEFRVEAAARSSQLLEDLSTLLLSRQNENAESEICAEPVKRVGLGIYYHQGIAADDDGSK